MSRAGECLRRVGEILATGGLCLVYKRRAWAAERALLDAGLSVPVISDEQPTLNASHVGPEILTEATPQIHVFRKPYDWKDEV